MPAQRRVRERKRQPTAAAGQMLEPLRHRRKRDGDGECGQRERDTSKTQGGNPEQVADRAGDETGDRDREDRAHPMVGNRLRRVLTEELEPFPAEDEDRGRVPADAHECGMAERDLSVVAREDVQTEQRDEVDRDVRELPEPEFTGEPRQQRDQDDRRGEDEALQRRRCPAPRQTLCTTTRPKRPVGRMTSTSNRTARAVGSLSSCPTKLT